MQKPTYDPGLTQQYTGPLRRTINDDGSFNVLRRGSSWRYVHPYLFLLNVSWPVFILMLLAAYFVANVAFALIYWQFADGQLIGNNAITPWGRFLNDFFFSSHTLTTVGYGNIAPNGLTANIVSSIEALAGLLAFAIATGLLFGRFSRPSARIGFSRKLLVAPYGDGMSLQFRVVNLRPNALIDLEARVLLMTVERSSGDSLRRVYKQLTLERPAIMFLPLSWTIVHPLEEDSPLRGLTRDSCDRSEAELLILIKAWDDTFSQTVHARYSYRCDEFLWDYRFAPTFHVNDEGTLVLDVDKVSDVLPASGPQQPKLVT
jgi:inward rectifier potassium channel